MEFPLVSVVIPTYNRAEYLKQAIESVLNQTYTNFELLILDNCSPDHTSYIVTQFNDPRIKYIRHICNIRGMANWSYGIYLAKGEYISILCDDDMFGQDFLIKRVRVFSLDSRIVSVFGELSYTNTNSNIFPKDQKSEDTQIYNGINAFKIVLDKQIVASSMFKRESLQLSWEKALAGGKTMDVLICALLSKNPHNKIGYISNLRDYIYRVHPNQDSSENRMLVAEDGARMYKVLMENSPTVVQKICKKKNIEHWNCNGRIFWDLNRKSEAAKCFKEELFLQPFKISTMMRYLRCLCPFGKKFLYCKLF